MLLRMILLATALAIPLALTYWAILDIPKRRFSSTKSKVIWFTVVATVPCIGAIFYLLMGRRRTQPL